MTAGIQIYSTTTGFIQIDQNYTNFMLAQKGTVTTLSPPGPSGFDRFNPTGSRVSVSGSFYAPMVALRSSSPVAMEQLGNLGSIGTTSPNISTINLWSEDGPGATIDYWIFDIARNGLAIDSSAAKFEVYNDSADLVFSSLFHSMNVQSGFAVNFSSLPGTITYPSGKTFAHASTYARSNYSVTGASTGTGDAWVEIPGGSWSSNVFTPLPITTTGTHTSGITNTAPTGTGNYLIIDVTGL